MLKLLDSRTNHLREKFGVLEMRLFLLAITLLAIPAFGEISDDPSRWQLEVEVDEFTDKRKVYALVVSETGMSGGFIHVMCSGDDYFEVKVGAGEYIGDKIIPNNMMYRIDKNEPVKLSMKPTSKTFVYVNDKNSRFIQDLMNGAEKVVIRLTSYDFDTSTARFTLNGSTQALQEVLTSCAKA
jgi:hypothetical protein